MTIRTPNEYISRRDRRQAAPEQTFREAEYIDRLSKSRTPVVVKLIDGEEVKGWIEYYDKDIIRITRDAQPNLFIYKSRVKYLYEDPAGNSRHARRKVNGLILPYYERVKKKRAICCPDCPRHVENCKRIPVP